MDALVLNIVSGPGIVVPRRISARLTPGAGALRIVHTHTVAADWAASVRHAWATALASAPHRPEHDAEVLVDGAAALAGGSAGLTCGLMFLAALRGVELPPFFATGSVVDDRGTLRGGSAAQLKAKAADDIARSLGWSAPPFLYPAEASAPQAERVQPRGVRSVHEAFMALSRTHA